MRDLPVRAVDQDRLRVRQLALARRRIAHVADGHRAGQLRQRFAVEDVGDVAHRLRDAHLRAVGGGDARALLAAVLQRVQAEVGHVGRFGVAEDAEDAALVLEFVEHVRPILLSEIPIDRRRPRSLGVVDRHVDRHAAPAAAMRSRLPPVWPMTRAGTPAAAACAHDLRHVLRCHRDDHARRRLAEQRRSRVRARGSREPPGPRRSRRRRRSRGRVEAALRERDREAAVRAIVARSDQPRSASQPHEQVLQRALAIEIERGRHAAHQSCTSLQVFAPPKLATPLAEQHHGVARGPGSGR